MAPKPSFTILNSRGMRSSFLDGVQANVTENKAKNSHMPPLSTDPPSTARRDEVRKCLSSHFKRGRYNPRSSRSKINDSLRTTYCRRMHWALVAGDAASCRLGLLHRRLPPSASVAPEQSIDARHYSHAAENILNWAIHISSSRKQGTARSRSRFFSDDRAVTCVT